MRPLWKILEECIDKKMMVRFSAFPGGHRNLGIYHNDEQWLYEGKSLDEIETQVVKDFPLSKPSLPIPEGFPKP